MVLTIKDVACSDLFAHLAAGRWLIHLYHSLAVAESQRNPNQIDIGRAVNRVI